MGVFSKYEIEIIGDPKKCKCTYTDSGSIVGTFGTLGPKGKNFAPPADTHVIEDCKGGYDAPGVEALVGEHGDLPFSMNWNITLTVRCVGSIGDPKDASATVTGSAQGKATW